MSTLYTSWDTIAPNRTESVYFWGAYELSNEEFHRNLQERKELQEAKHKLVRAVLEALRDFGALTALGLRV